MRNLINVVAVLLLASTMVLAQTSQSELLNQFEASKSEPIKAYSLAKTYLSRYQDDSEQTAQVRQWLAAYESVTAHASETGLGGTPATLLTGYGRTIFAEGNKGHIFLEPDQLVFKGKKGDLALKRADIQNVKAEAYSRWSDNDTQYFYVEVKENGKKKKYGFYASSEGWVANGDKDGKMVDPKPVVAQISEWLR